MFLVTRHFEFLDAEATSPRGPRLSRSDFDRRSNPRLSEHRELQFNVLNSDPMDIGHCGLSYDHAHEPTRALWLGGEFHLEVTPPHRKSSSEILSRFDWPVESSISYVRITHHSLSCRGSQVRHYASSAVAAPPPTSLDRPTRLSHTAASDSNS